jgi:MoaA/NifB/PqqE/SkfB family radical SAM enzyme
MRRTNKFERTTLESDVVKRIIDHAVKMDISALSFTGGEPLLFPKHLINLINYADRAGIPFIRTGTNGFIFRNPDSTDFTDRVKRFAETIAGTGLYTLWISIDSADPVIHEQMRGISGVIKGLEKALPILHSYGIYPAANLGINRNTGGRNEMLYQVARGERQFSPDEHYEIFIEAFRKFYRFIIDLGFTMTNACYPMSIDATDPEGLDAVYTATSSNHVITFTTEEKISIFKALFNTIPEFRPYIRIFSPRVSLYSLIREYEGSSVRTYPCRGGIDYFFITSSNARTYPCGYRGTDDLGHFWDLDVEKIKIKPYCKACDWECFRDPSFLLGPAMKPTTIISRLLHDRKFIKIWLEDLKYYRECEYFNGRKPPPYRKMEKFLLKR